MDTPERFCYRFKKGRQLWRDKVAFHVHVFEIFRKNGGNFKESSIQVAQVVTPVRSSVGSFQNFSHTLQTYWRCAWGLHWVRIIWWHVKVVFFSSLKLWKDFSSVWWQTKFPNSELNLDWLLHFLYICHNLHIPQPLYITIVWVQKHFKWYIQTKHYRLYRKITIYGIFSG